MARVERDEEREHRIHMEAIVDAYGTEEQAMSCYYYLEDKIAFPYKQLQGSLRQVVVCALRRRIDSPGESPGRLTVVPTESTWGGSRGDEWAEAL